ncbi:MAG: hypothetical protein ACLP1X_18205 [Polyangiaceae bacterium]
MARPDPGASVGPSEDGLCRVAPLWVFALVVLVASACGGKVPVPEVGSDASYDAGGAGPMGDDASSSSGGGASSGGNATSSGGSSSGSMGGGSSSGSSSSSGGSSGGAGSCSTWCTGCCANNICNMGGADTACGIRGASCTDCTRTGETCRVGQTPALDAGVCGPSCATCAGCCDENGVCNSGALDATCGTGGALCANCTTSGLTCGGGVCRAP